MLVSIWKNYSYVILLMGLAVIMGSVALMKVGTGESYQTVTVQEGDSLWTIADELSEEHNMSTQELVKWVSKKNNLSTDIIKPGETLVIPMEKSLLRNYGSYELASGKE
ncbi:LysM peptidoglycan-binding domain-containing protein [Bacillus sp. SCS-153A]|uniref:cell division suppressor protein YneA n=1 Tax=Rossellomorea sedimentorum TaxID=3115294 RepID=UPI0039059716